ncbi:MAG: AAA family ATPase, partial [Chloroflexi bacterium]
MTKEPANSYWLQNNNNTPQRSRNQLRPGPAGRPNGQPPQRGMSSINRWLLIIVLVMLGIYLYQFFNANNNNTSSQRKELAYSDFYNQINDGNIKSATIIGSSDITGDFCSPVGGFSTYHVVQLPNGDPNLVPILTQPSAPGFKKPTCVNMTTVITQPPTDSSFWLNILIAFLPFIFLIAIFVFISRRATQGQQGIFSFGKSRAKLILEDRPSTTFADVAGVDEAKYDLQEVVEFLKTPSKYQRLGGKIPRGVLLVGPPGTGKTLLARAVAGEAGVPFYSMSGSEFVEVLVGVGASRVRDLFDQAKKAAPSIIFIDEIDAVGRQRGSSINSNDEREQTLNQLLVEMDGFDTRQAVVVIGATNRPDGLDIALLAARRNLDYVNQRCFEEALDKILLGAERPLVLSEADLNVTAYHEGGHALAGMLSEHGDPITKVTIVPRGQALGVTMATPLDDRYNYSKEYLLTQIVYALGGRA